MSSIFGSFADTATGYYPTDASDAGYFGTGTGAIAIGMAAATTATNNIAIGYGANSTLTTGNDTIAIGYNASTSNYSNSIAIGSGAQAYAPNTCTISANELYLESKNGKIAVLETLQELLATQKDIRGYLLFKLLNKRLSILCLDVRLMVESFVGPPLSRAS
jgi:hypothetical protein